MPTQPELEMWLDAHLSPILAKRIADTFGWTVKSGYALKLEGFSDEQIFLKAREAGQIIILTKDVDFVDVMRQHGPPPKVLRLINANKKTKTIWEALEPVLERHVRNLISFGQTIETVDLKLT